MQVGPASSWPPANCNFLSGGVSWFRVRDSTAEVEQLVGGTRGGTDYVYVEDESGLLTNVKYLRGARIISRREWGRDRTEEVYEVPLDVIGDRLIMRISFSNSGYTNATLCRLSGKSIECYSCPPVERITREYAGRFRILGDERAYVDLYMRFVPTFVSEVLNVMRGGLGGLRTLSLAVMRLGLGRPLRTHTYRYSHQWL